MKDKMKYIFRGLFVVVSVALLLSSDYIIAFAKSMFVMDYEYNMVYETGDEIILKEDENNYTPYFFVGYLDKDGTLLDFHSVMHEYTSGVDVNSYYVGESCWDNIKRISPKYYTDSYQANRCNNKYRGAINYVVDEEKLHSISQWKLLDNSYKDIRYYCNAYDIDLSLCIDVISAYESGRTLYANYPILMFQEYTSAVFEINCDKTTVKYGEKTNCQVNVAHSEGLNYFRTSLYNTSFNISDIKVKEGWTYKIDEDGYYLFGNVLDEDGSGEIFTFTATPKEDVSSDTSIDTVDFQYQVIGSDYEDSATVSSTMSVTTGKNPNTNSNLTDLTIILVLLVLAATIGFVGVSYKKKKIME